ncbi:DinB family protein [Flavobacterium jejuense]|uniref:DinB family protein n=1 Tax=Flavobacterium jejuense TaxID=1544455 RepID=A0ABX0IQ52_9FLAO|nr:DinB family protein [Flavobacterium jejuense]NHN25964.1 DinB family protein [Flavobacterium jejuense]
MITFNKDEFAPFYADYIAKSLLHTDIVGGLKQQQEKIVSFFKSIPENKQEFRYEIGKWTPKDILLHLIDAERIFTYRALRISRNDQTALSGFEENDYVPNAGANSRNMDSLIEEYETVRNATISLFSSLTEEQLLRIGIASGSTVSVRAIGCIILGHELHHVSVIKERYL